LARRTDLNQADRRATICTGDKLRARTKKSETEDRCGGNESMIGENPYAENQADPTIGTGKTRQREEPGSIIEERLQSGQRATKRREIEGLEWRQQN
jgi:hypothetical protein